MGRTFHFKLVLLGDSSVGKSCLVVRFVRDEFFEYQEPTIGAAFLTQTVALNDTTVASGGDDGAARRGHTFGFPRRAAVSRRASKDGVHLVHL